MASRRRHLHVELSLVPLADMLTNTVGIMIFVMVFAVLVAQGTFIGKHLPMGQKTTKEPVLFICSDNTILPWHLQRLGEEFFSAIPKMTAHNFESWKNRVNSRRVEDELFVLTARCQGWKEERPVAFGTEIEAKIEYLVLEVNLRSGVRGDLPGQVGHPASALRRELSRMDRNRQHLFFLVDTDSLEAFRQARDVARGLGFDTGWAPERTTWPVRVVVVPRPERPAAGGFDFGSIILR